MCMDMSVCVCDLFEDSSHWRSVDRDQMRSSEVNVCVCVCVPSPSSHVDEADSTWSNVCGSSVALSLNGSAGSV